MNNLIDITNRLRCWFAQNNISTDGLTVILNFQDADAAARFDWQLNKELSDLRIMWSNHAPRPWLVTTRFKMNDLSMKVESPIHEAGTEIKQVEIG